MSFLYSLHGIKGNGKIQYIFKFTHILRIKKQLPCYNKETHVVSDAIFFMSCRYNTWLHFATIVLVDNIIISEKLIKKMLTVTK